MVKPISRVFKVPTNASEQEESSMPGQSVMSSHSLALEDDVPTFCETREFSKESGLMAWNALTQEEQDSVATVVSPLMDI